MSTNDEHDLNRFVDAQRSTYERALAELRGGRKRSHWMWYVFPQLAGLGRSATSRHFAIASADEAKAYLEHPLLGPRFGRMLGCRPRGRRAIRLRNLRISGRSQAAFLRDAVRTGLTAGIPISRRCSLSTSADERTARRCVCWSLHADRPALGAAGSFGPIAQRGRGRLLSVHGSPETENERPPKFLAVVMAAVAALAAPIAALAAPPLTIKEQGSFFVGGENKTVAQPGCRPDPGAVRARSPSTRCTCSTRSR